MNIIYYLFIFRIAYMPNIAHQALYIIKLK